MSSTVLIVSVIIYKTFGPGNFIKCPGAPSLLRAGRASMIGPLNMTLIIIVVFNFPALNLAYLCVKYDCTYLSGPEFCP